MHVDRDRGCCRILFEHSKELGALQKDMESYADYRFQFPAKNRKGHDKIASYLLWISSNGENVEIMTDSKKYVKLAKQDAADLYEIITGESLIK